MPKEMSSEGLVESVGRYVVLYKRDFGKYVGRVISVDMKSRQMTYEVMSGPNKGMRRVGKFVEGRPFKMYGDNELIKALLEV